MVDKSSVVDFAVYQSTGINIEIAIEVLKKKGLTIEELSDRAKKLLDSSMDDVEKKDMDDHYKVLLHLVMSYILFKTAVTSYDKWIKDVAAEHNMKPGKYAKIIYSL